MGEGLVEVDDREGIAFDRVDGITMHQHVMEQPEEAVACGRALAELHARMHERHAPGLHHLRFVLAGSVSGASHLDARTKAAVLDVLDSLPGGVNLCHNDLHPMNVLLSGERWVVIDWAAGLRGNRLAGHARSWLLSRFWLDGLAGGGADMLRAWGRFWPAYTERYRALAPVAVEDLRGWQTVVSAVSLAWDRSVPDPGTRVEFIAASLEGRPHRWLTAG